MALPLLAGIVVGSLTVIALNNKNEIKDKVSSSAKKVKKVAETGLEKTKEMANSVKETAKEKLCDKEEKIIKEETNA